MGYQALYRVWRPQDFNDVVGQQHITTTLQNALQNATYTHAYLFSGPRGTGKTSLAKIMAKAVNCAQAPVSNPCNECAACTGITSGRIVDVIEIDAASNNGVDEIRDLRDKVKYAPTEVSVKVYIIDEVHMLSQGAFNALLKTLEEPPLHVMFILATTEPHKIPLTIISRCQRFDFRRVAPQAMVDRLQLICSQEQISIAEEALQLIVQVAEGGMRDALSLLDQAVSFAEQEVTLEDILVITGSFRHDVLSTLADDLMFGRIEEAIRLLNKMMDEGKDPSRLVTDLIYYFRDVLLFRQAPQLDDVLERAQNTEEWQHKVAGYDEQNIFKAIQHLSKAQQDIKWSHHPRIHVEVAFIQFAHSMTNMHIAKTNEEHDVDRQQQLSSGGQLEQLQDKIQQMEKEIQALQQAARFQEGRPSTGQGFAEQRQGAYSVGMRSTSVTAGQGNAGQSSAGQSSAGQSNVLASSSTVLVRKLLPQASKSLLQELSAQWETIMHKIKMDNVRVHAWLIDGAPVACSPDYFVVAFRSDIHRETTEKENHRSLIEATVQKQMNNRAKLVTIMYNDWEDLKESFIREQQGQTSSADESRDPFYEEAVKLVGEDLIETKEDSS